MTTYRNIQFEWFETKDGEAKLRISDHGVEAILSSDKAYTLKTINSFAQYAAEMLIDKYIMHKKLEDFVNQKMGK